MAHAKILGHLVHPMLVMLPIGLFTGTVLFDIIHLATDSETAGTVAYWTLGVGVLGALLAAAVGANDWAQIEKGTRAKRVATLHGIGNVLGAALFALSWWLRRDDPGAVDALAMTLSFIAYAGLMVTGWLGAELIERLGVGIPVGTDLNAPSSLRRKGGDDPVRAPSPATA